MSPSSLPPLILVFYLLNLQLHVCDFGFGREVEGEGEEVREGAEVMILVQTDVKRRVREEKETCNNNSSRWGERKKLDDGTSFSKSERKYIDCYFFSSGQRQSHRLQFLSGSKKLECEREEVNRVFSEPATTTRTFSSNSLRH